MVIDHICFAVKNIDESVFYWHDVFGYERMTETVINTIQMVKVTFLQKENSVTVKLIEPLPENKTLINFVNRNNGFHHVCFRCENINNSVAGFSKKGLRLLTPPEPGEAFNNNLIAFLFSQQGFNVELIDTEEKAGIINKSK